MNEEIGELEKILLMDDDELLSRYANIWHRAEEARREMLFEVAEGAVQDSLPYRHEILKRMGRRSSHEFI